MAQVPDHLGAGGASRAHDRQRAGKIIMSARAFHEVPAQSFPRYPEVMLLEPLIILPGKGVVPRGRDKIEPRLVFRVMSGTLKARPEKCVEHAPRFHGTKVFRFPIHSPGAFQGSTAIAGRRTRRGFTNRGNVIVVIVGSARKCAASARVVFSNFA